MRVNISVSAELMGIVLTLVYHAIVTHFSRWIWQMLVNFILFCQCLSNYDYVRQGFITNKMALPIAKLEFGRIFAQTSSSQHRLGKLECSGFESFHKVPTSCEDLKREGHSLNGIYTVKENNNIKVVFCDMGKLPGDKGILFNYNIVLLFICYNCFIVQLYL